MSRRTHLHEASHVASFQPHDPPQLIWATFACGFCLHDAYLITIGGSPHKRIAHAHCASCGESTRVHLTDCQAYVLWTMPRGRVFVQVSPEAW